MWMRHLAVWLVVSLTLIVQASHGQGQTGFVDTNVRSFPATEQFALAGVTVPVDADGDGAVDVMFLRQRKLFAGFCLLVGRQNELACEELELYAGGAGSLLAILDVVDVNGDGLEDVMMLDSPNAVFAMLNPGARTAWTIVDLPYIADQVLGMDWNSDGLIDLVWANHTGAVVVQFGSGAAAWGPPVVVDADHGGTMSGGVDLDGSGTPDVVIVNTNVTVLLFNETGQVEVVEVGESLPLSFYVSLIDIDGDGDMDILEKTFVASGPDGLCSRWLENVQGNGRVWLSHKIDVCAIGVLATNYPEDGTLVFRSTSYVISFMKWNGTALVPAGTLGGLAGNAFALMDLDRTGAPFDLIAASLTTFGFVLYDQPFAADAVVVADRVAGNSSVLAGEVGSRFTLNVSFPSIVDRAAPSTFPFDAAAVEVIMAPSLLAEVTARVGGFLISILMETPQLHTMDVRLFGAEQISGAPFSIVAVLRCPPGSRVDAFQQCQLCPANTYGLDEFSTTTDCTACPTLTTSVPGSTSFLNCTCDAGTWGGFGTRSPESPCYSCPAGGVCRGGASRPVAAPGFFEHPVGSARFIECLRSGCAGDNLCAKGYVGFLCSECSESYYSASPTECRACPGGASALFGFGVVSVLVAMVVAAAVVVFTMARAVRRSETSMTASKINAPIYAFRSRMFPMAFVLFIINVQICAVVSIASLSWTSTTQSAFTVIQSMSFDSQSLAAECTTQSWHNDYLVSVIVPIVILVGSTVLVCLARLFAGLLPGKLAAVARVGLVVVIDATLFLIAPLMYIPVSRAAFSLLACRPIADGSYVLSLDPGVQCFDAAWWRVFPVGATVIGGYVIGLPAYFGFRLFSHRNVLSNPDTLIQFGALYRSYRLTMYWGELANLLRRLIVVLVVVFAMSSPIITLVLLMFFVTISIYLVTRLRPYHFPSYNDMDTHHSIILMMFLLMGTASHTQRKSTSSDAFLSTGSIACLVALFVYGIASTAYDVRSLVLEQRAGTNSGLTAIQRRHAQLSAAVHAELDDIQASDGVRLSADAFFRALAIEDNPHASDPMDFATSHTEMASLTMDRLDNPYPYSPPDSSSSSK